MSTTLEFLIDQFSKLDDFRLNHSGVHHIIGGKFVESVVYAFGVRRNDFVSYYDIALFGGKYDSYEEYTASRLAFPAFELLQKNDLPPDRAIISLSVISGIPLISLESNFHKLIEESITLETLFNKVVEIGNTNYVQSLDNSFRNLYLAIITNHYLKSLCLPVIHCQNLLTKEFSKEIFYQDLADSLDIWCNLDLGKLPSPNTGSNPSLTFEDLFELADLVAP